MKSKVNNKLEIDKNSIQYRKYKDIALEFIKQGYNNIRGIYHKYYPKASEASLEVEPYRMIDNVRFIAALEEAWQEIKIEDLDIARDVIRVLHNITLKGKKDADRINAASWLGKSKGMFIDKTQEVPIEKEDNQFSFDRLSKIKLEDTKSISASEN